MELKDHEGSAALWLAVQYITVSSDQSVNPFEDTPVVNGTSFDENSFAARLIQRGSNTDAPDTVTGKTRHLCSPSSEGVKVYMPGSWKLNLAYKLNGIFHKT